MDRFLARVAGVLTDPGRRRRAIRNCLDFLFLGYAVIVTVLLLLAGIVGERNPATVFVLYLPPQLWLVPPLLLLGPALLVHRRLAGIIVAGCLLFGWAYIDWEHPPSARLREQAGLTVLTFNRGQQGGSLQPFKNSLEPDVIAMQEAGKRARNYLSSPDYKEFAHANDTGEFMLLSKFPINDSGLLRFRSGGTEHTVAAWFVIDYGPVPVVIYNVHLPTPRDQLRAYRRGAFLWGILGLPGTPLAAKRRHYQEFWDIQMDLARQLDAHVRADSRPYLMVGDFNAPARGVIYRRLADGREDAHEAAGRGFGFTFPGVTRNPISLFGPWLRLDHLYAGPGWRTLECETESDRQSQHLAVAARFALDPAVLSGSQ